MENYVKIMQLYIQLMLCMALTGAVIFILSEVYKNIFKK